MPWPPLATLAVPAAFVPIRLPWMVHRSRVPPYRRRYCRSRRCRRRRRCRRWSRTRSWRCRPPFALAAVPSAFVPMKFPMTVPLPDSRDRDAVARNEIAVAGARTAGRDTGHPADRYRAPAPPGCPRRCSVRRCCRRSSAGPGHGDASREGVDDRRRIVDGYDGGSADRQAGPATGALEANAGRAARVSADVAGWVIAGRSRRDHDDRGPAADAEADAVRACRAGIAVARKPADVGCEDRCPERAESVHRKLLIGRCRDQDDVPHGGHRMRRGRPGAPTSATSAVRPAAAKVAHR